MKKKTGTSFDVTELHRAPRSHWRTALIVTVYLFAFIILDFFTRTFEEFPGVVAWYPPAGLGFALLLVFGARFAPALGIASLLSSFFIYHIPQPPETLFLWAFFISLIYGVAITFLRHRTRFNWQLQKSRDVVFLIFTTVLVSTILAVLSILGSTLSGEMPRSEVLSMIFHWWIGETVGVLTVTPFLLIYVMPGLKRFVEGQPVRLSAHRSFPHQTLSVIGQAFSLVFVLYWVFGAHILDEFQPLYLIFLPLVWIALQRGFRGITVGIVALNFGVITALWFFRFDFARLSELQLLMIVNCIVGLLMGAVVTERKSSEKDLQQITKDWEETFDILNESISIHDMDFNITRSNKASERLLGKNAQEILSAKCFASYHGKNCPPTGCPGCESLKTGKSSAFEIFEPHLNKYIEVKALPRFDEKNNIVGLVHIVKDITERKQAEEALRESEEKYRLIVENAHDGIEITQHERIMFANAQLAEMLGYTLDEIINVNSHKIFTEQGIRELLERKKNREAGKPELYQYETTFLKKDGTVIDVEVRYRIIDYNGEAATFAIIRDITKRKQTEEELKESEASYRTLAENMPGIVYRVNLRQHSNMQFFNAMIETLTGFKADELVTGEICSIEPLILPEDRREVLEIVNRAVKEVHPFEVEYRLRRKDAEIRNFVERGSIVRGADGKPLYIDGFIFDITERKQAEEEISKYKMAMERSHESIFITQVDGTIIYINPAFEQFYGYSANEVVGKTPRVIKSGLMNQEQYKKFWDSLLASQTLTGEIVNKTKDGRLVTVYASDNPILDAEGKLVGFMSIQTDLTEQKQAEKALQENELQYRTLADSGQALIWTSGPDRKCDYFNQPWLKFTGRTLEQELGDGWAEGVYPDDLARCIGIYTSAFDKREHFSMDYRLRRFDGGFHWIQDDGTPRYDSNGDFLGYIGHCLDITERKMAEEALRKSEEKFRGIFENVQDAYYETTEEGTIVEISPSIEILSKGQYHREEVIGRSMSEFYVDPERRQILLTELKEHGAVSDFEIYLSNKDGSLIPCSITSSLHMDALSHQKKIVGSIRDISEHKRAEETKKILEIQLQHSQKLESLGTLASGIAHDFNNILAIIIGHASLIEMGEVQTTRMTDSLQAIQKAGQRGTALVKQLLTFARKSEPSLQAVNINQIIEELLKLFTETFPKTIEVKKQMGKIPFLLGDAGQLHQVLLNLCVNARDAMPNGGSLTVRTDTVMGDAVRLLLPQASAAEYVRIEISDTGTGISEMTIKRIFDPFFTTKEHGKGTGLGLSIVFGIVTNHNGFILVDSALGKGTAFTVYLPVPKESESLEISTDQEIKDIAGGNETILIIEDEEMVQNFLKEVLEKKGYHVVTADDGKAALQKYNEQRSEIDLIISDIGLPVMNGIELFERLIVANPQVKVIIASGYFEPEKKSDLLSRGLKSFIQKPYKPTEVWAKVREVLDVSL